MLGCGRIYRSDFRHFKYLSDLQQSLASGSLTPSLTSLSAGRNSTGFDRAGSPGASSNAATSALAGAGPDAPGAGAGGAAAADSDQIVAAAAAVAASAGALGAVAAAAAAGDTQDAVYRLDSAGPSSRASGASADAPLVVSISSDGGGAGSQAGSKKQGSSQASAASARPAGS